MRDGDFLCCSQTFRLLCIRMGGTKGCVRAELFGWASMGAETTDGFQGC